MNSSDRKQAFKAFEVVKHSTLKICNSAGDIIGTGFFVSSEGHFVTCAHVVADAEGLGKLIANGHVGITECYIGDANKDDIALLQVIDHKSPIFLHLVDLPEDQTFRCFGFSNEIYKDGAPIEGKIVGLATSTDSTLLNQRVLRLVTEGDSQAIKGGQSGAAVCVYNAKKKQWQAVGILVASEGSNGGIALPITNTVRQLIPIDPNILRWKIAKIITGIAAISLISCTLLWFSLRKCSDERLLSFSTSIDTLLTTDLIKASELADKFEKECSSNAESLIAKGFVIRKKGSQSNPKNQTDLELARQKFQEVLDNPENKNHIIAIYGLGLVFHDMDKYKYAIKELKKIEEEESIKIKVWFRIALSYSALEDFTEAENYLKRIIQNIQNQKIQWNEINSQRDDFKYYQQSLRQLMIINGTLWYKNRENSDKKKYFFDNYKKYNEIFFAETILPKNKKPELDSLVNKIFSSKNSDFFAVLVKTDEYKYMLCNFYETYGLEKPNKLQCKS
jgi:tetratricopeptide (TPR) repeat protein